MNNLDEGFFKDKYESYKDKVLSILYKHFGIKLPKDLHDAEDWIRDYFVDKFSAFDCADSMRTHFRQYGVAENMKMDFETAKQILTENHYILESEGDLVDYFTYQIKAEEAKYDYLIKKAKNKNLTFEPYM